MNSAVVVQSPASAGPSALESPEGAPETLRAWLKNKKELSFVYFRSLGGFIQTGRARLTGMDSEYLELRSAGTTIIVVSRGAKYSTEPQIFFNPSFSSARAIPGVAVSLENFDWLFLCPAQDKDLMVHGHVLPGA
jgi:hypothetical protein